MFSLLVSRDGATLINVVPSEVAFKTLAVCLQASVMKGLSCYGKGIPRMKQDALSLAR